MSEFATSLRTHTCGELRAKDVAPAKPPAAGDRAPALVAGAVTLCGHVDRKLDETRLLLRDRYGKTLVAVDPDALPYVADRFRKLGLEDVIQVAGDVALRPAAEKDAASPTGEVFVKARKLELLSLAMPPPEGVLTAPSVSVDERITYRQVYLRRPEMQARLGLRSKVMQAAREFLLANRFLEIDTPQLFLYDSVAIETDVVPVSEKLAFSLSGGPLVGDTYIRPSHFDRFFQILPITTNERAPSPLHAQEFVGLDLNMAYVEAADFMGMVEMLLAHVWKAALGVDVKAPFRRIPWHEAMLKYGTEKPDLRYALEVADLGAAAGEGTTSRALVAKGGAKLDDAALAEAAGEDAKWARAGADGKLAGPASALLEKHAKALGAAPGDALVVATAKSEHAAATAAGAARARLAKKLGLASEKGPPAFCWVTNIPVFDHQGRPKSIVFAQLAREEDRRVFMTRDEAGRLKVQSKAFDLILDGVELASGYVGMHYLTEQRQFWERIHKLGLEDMARMRAPIEAHRFGCPPFAAMNIGLDRVLARMLRLDAIDEVMALPKTRDCKMPVLGAPGPAPRDAARPILAEDASLAPMPPEEKIEAS